MTQPSVLSSDAVTGSGEKDIVAAAAVARLTKDNSFGGSIVFDHVNIVNRYGSLTSDGFLDVGSHNPLIGADVQAAIEQALLPMAVSWVRSLSAVIGTAQDIPTYEEVGPVLTLSTPNVAGNHATITTGLWCGDQCGAGGTYTVQRTEPQGWAVTGTEGMS